MNPIFCVDNKQLFMKHILVYMDYPLLFACIDKDNCYYLTLAVDISEGYYLIAKITNKTLCNVINGNKTIRNALEESTLLYKVITGNQNINDKTFQIKFYDLDEDDLPTKDSFLRLSEEKIQEIIKVL